MANQPANISIVICCLIQIASATTQTCPISYIPKKPPTDTYNPVAPTFNRKRNAHIIIHTTPKTDTVIYTIYKACPPLYQYTNITSLVSNTTICFNLSAATKLHIRATADFQTIQQLVPLVAAHKPTLILQVDPSDTVVRAIAYLRVFLDYDTLAATTPRFDVPPTQAINYVIRHRRQHEPINIVELS
jgi:hypothetical protein